MAELKQEPEVIFEYCVLCSQNFSSQQECFYDEENVFKSVKACFSIPYPYNIDGAVCPSCRQRLTKAQRLKRFISDTLTKLDSLRSSLPEVEHAEDKSPCCVPSDVGVSTNDQSHLDRPVFNSDFKCKICLKAFKAYSNLKSHMKTHRVRNLKCDVCSKCFKTKGDLKSHMISHSDERNFKCDICQMAFKRGSSLRQHAISHCDGFRCKLCTKAFASKSELRSHRVSHRDERNFRCGVCFKAFKKNEVLKTHMASHSDERNFKCNICSQAFKLKNTLKKHMHRHDDKEKFECSVCLRVFKYISGLKFHMITHDDQRNFKCGACSKTFKLRGSLEKHANSRCVKKIYSCSSCSKTFGDKSSFRAHLKRTRDEGDFKCDVCHKEFRHKWDFELHTSGHSRRTVRVNLVRLEHLEPFTVRGSADRLTYTVTPADVLSLRSEEAGCVKHTIEKETDPGSGSETIHRIKCGVCSEPFSYKDLVNHLTVVHGGSDRFICELCCQVFNAKDHLRAHMRRHNRKRKFESDPRTKTIETNGVSKHRVTFHGVMRSFECRGQYFECDVCSKVFQRKSNLKVHMIVHSDVRNFKCGVCSKGFKTNGLLNIHMFSHNDAKNFKCDVCFKAFKSKTSLNHHLNLHSDEKNYECPFCSKTYKIEPSLKVHIRKYCKFQRNSKSNGM